MPSHMLKTHQNHKFQVLGPCPCDFISLDKSRTIGYFIYSLEKNSEGKFMMKLEFLFTFQVVLPDWNFLKDQKIGHFKQFICSWKGNWQNAPLCTAWKVNKVFSKWNELLSWLYVYLLYFRRGKIIATTTV